MNSIPTRPSVEPTLPPGVHPSRERISVIIPVYNGALYLAEAIESVLFQTHPIDEILVVDDGSTDGSAAIASGFHQVRLLRKEHSGITGTLNRGLLESTGDLISFLDADDRWLPSKTEHQLRALRERPELSGAFGQARRFRMTQPQAGAANEVELDVIPGVSKVAALLHRRVFDQIGFFATDQTHEFMDWYARGLDAGMQFEVLPEVVFERRLHFSNCGITDRSDQRNRYLTTLKAHLDRRRAATSTSKPR